MSKMGICTISSYRGSELYEIIGIDKDLVNELFKFSKTRTEGYGYKYFYDNLKIYGNEEVKKLV
jgi:glutamate synthase (NADPH/NADH) large chain